MQFSFGLFPLGNILHNAQRFERLALCSEGDVGLDEDPTHVALQDNSVFDIVGSTLHRRHPGCLHVGLVVRMGQGQQRLGCMRRSGEPSKLVRTCRGGLKGFRLEVGSPTG